MNFPSSPTIGQTYTFEGVTWRYNGKAWALYVRPQLDLDGATELTLNAEHYDTFASDVVFTLASTPANKDVVFINAVITDETGTSMTFDFGAGIRRVGSEGLISALLAPEGNHVLVLKYIGGEWWLSDSFGTVTETAYVTPTVATPTFDPAAGSFASSQNVTISCATASSNIYYTTNGDTPTSSSSLYSSAIAISSTTTLKAIAIRTGYNNSDVATGTFAIDSVAPEISGTPTINTAGTQLTVTFTENVQIGAGGSGGLSVDAVDNDFTLTYASGDGTTSLVFDTSRTIIAGEALSNLSYIQPGNGIEDALGNDILSFSGVAVTNNSTASEAPVPDILWWKLNDAAGTTIVADVGPGSTTNTGTLNGDHLTMASSGNANFKSSSNVTYGASIVTLSFWYQQPTTHNSGIIYSVDISEAPRFFVTGSSAQMSFGISGATGGLTRATTGTSIVVDTWYHYVAIFDNSTEAGEVTIYRNGATITSSISSNTKTGTGSFATSKFQIKNPFSTASGFKIDDIRVYSGALSSGEVEAIYTAGRQ